MRREVSLGKALGWVKGQLSSLPEEEPATQPTPGE
jgi:hypothetical protein